MDSVTIGFMETTTNNTMELNNEALTAGGVTVSKGRLESLTIAQGLGADYATMVTLRDAVRLNRGEAVIIPMDHLETLSRGKGWARMGNGSGAVWGERKDGGYRVGPGHWIVGGSDGFKRSNQTGWDVSHVTVGAQTWTVAV